MCLLSPVAKQTASSELNFGAESDDEDIDEIGQEIEATDAKRCLCSFAPISSPFTAQEPCLSPEDALLFGEGVLHHCAKKNAELSEDLLRITFYKHHRVYNIVLIINIEYMIE